VVERAKCVRGTKGKATDRMSLGNKSWGGNYGKGEAKRPRGETKRSHDAKYQKRKKVGVPQDRGHSTIPFVTGQKVEQLPHTRVQIQKETKMGRHRAIPNQRGWWVEWQRVWGEVLTLVQKKKGGGLGGKNDKKKCNNNPQTKKKKLGGWG